MRGSLDENRRCVYGLGMPPKPLEIVIGAGGLGEDVYDEIAVVHQNPLCGIVPFDTDGKLAALLHLFRDFIADRVPLARIG